MKQIYFLSILTFIFIFSVGIVSAVSEGFSCGYKSDSSPYCDSGLRCAYFQCVQDYDVTEPDWTCPSDYPKYIPDIDTCIKNSYDSGERCQKSDGWWFCDKGDVVAICSGNTLVCCPEEYPMISPYDSSQCWEFGWDCVKNSQCSSNKICSNNKCIIEQIECKESWSCDSWSSCINGKKTRNCHDKNNCPTDILEPFIEQSCEVIPPIQICAAVCTNLYVLPNCELNTCGSGCGADNINTFNSLNECKNKIAKQPITLYRFENNQCSSILILESERTNIDYLTLNECENKINPICPTVCTNLYVLPNCELNNCGSGCGEDRVNTFDSLNECKTNMIEPPIQETDFNFLFYIIPLVVLILIGFIVYNLIRRKR